MKIAPELLRAEGLSPAGVKAANILLGELKRRGLQGESGAAGRVFTVRLTEDDAIADDDVFTIAPEENGLRFSAKGLRGLIFAIGLFLRKTERTPAGLELNEEICGEHRPLKPVRGHQLGFRPCSNTYDAWRPEDFERYMLDLMFFGMNTVEFIPFTEQNALMRHTGPEMTALLSEKAHALGLNVSLWIPNGGGTEKEELAAREKLFSETPYIDAVFVPGADPGDLPPETLIDRCVKIHRILTKYHPNAELWPSAQAPHDTPGWGEGFLKALSAATDGTIAGVITGPNRAFDLDELRRRLPEKYPIRFYPDITHNLRCEHPVHFEKDDWHYAFSACLSRESVNPRPAEYKRLFDTVSPYTVGSVTYSDGVNDDVNKAVWCALEWDGSISAEEICEDYARLYLPECESAAAAAALLMLERNWNGAPTEKRIDDAYYFIMNLPSARGNWRLSQLKFRAACDMYIKARFLADTAAAGVGKALLLSGQKEAAAAALCAPEPENVRALREELGAYADLLNETSGMQLSVTAHGASGWERGATLDTVDLPITDREWLLHLAETAPDCAAAAGAIRQNDAEGCLARFSFAFDWPDGLRTAQDPGFYMNFQGDRPDVNDGTLPVRLQKVYDHYTFRARLPALPERRCALTVTYFKPTERFLCSHRAYLDGAPLAPPAPDAALNRNLPPRFQAYTYLIPAVPEPRQRNLLIEEPVAGFQLAGYRITVLEDDA